jgi:hypothetical protein
MMQKVVLVVILLVLAGPAVARDIQPSTFLPPPPPLPGMSRESQQEIIDRYYRRTEPERTEYRQYEEDDHRDDGALGKGKKKKHLPPGLKKKEARGKELPPGWQKKIARGQVLDRELRPHCRDLPRDLYRELPPPPKGTRLYQLEDRIIRVVEATFEIVDVFTFGR